MGRHRSDHPRRKVLRVRLSDEEFSSLIDICNERDSSIAAYIREMIAKEKDKKDETE